MLTNPFKKTMPSCLVSIKPFSHCSISTCDFENEL
jgi:hypothetical protein